MKNDYSKLPNILVPYKNGGVEDYMDAPEIVGKFVIALVKEAIFNENATKDFSVTERAVFRNWLKVTLQGLESALKLKEKAIAMNQKRWHGDNGGQARETRPPAPVTASETGADACSIDAAADGSTGAASGKRRGRFHGSTGADGSTGAASETGADASADHAPKLADNKNTVYVNLHYSPVAVALEIIGETGVKLSENALKKFLRKKGAAAFCDVVLTFYSELENGETVTNRGAALFARLNELPDIKK